MGRLLRSRVTIAIVALTVGLSIAGGVAAWAAIPHSVTGQITACYPTSGASKGVLRVIDTQAVPAQTCGTDASISWQKNGLRWKGAWSATVAYSANDVVWFGRARQSYVATVANTGVRPNFGTTWSELGGHSVMTPTQLGSLRWDQDPNRPVTLSVGSLPLGVAFDGTSVWVANYGSNTVSKISMLTNTVAATVAVGSSPQSVAFDGANIWVTNAGDSNVSKINPNTNAVTATVAVGGDPVAVAFDGSSVWVVNANGNNVSKINTTTNTVTATVAVGAFPYAAAFDGSNMWVTNAGDDNVSKINVTTNTVTATVTAGNGPFCAAFDGSSVWVCNQADNTISRLNPTTNTVTATIAVGFSPNGVAFDGSNV